MFDVGSFLARHARFFLHAAHTQTLEPIADSPELLAVLEAGYAAFWKGLTGTPLEKFLEGENAAVLYHAWMAEGAANGGARTRLSARYAPDWIELNSLIDLSKATRELLDDAVQEARALREAGPDAALDPDALLVLGLSLEIVKGQEDQLSDPLALQAARELRLHLTALREAAGGIDPVAAARIFLYRTLTAAFLSHALYRAARATLLQAALFSFHTGTLELCEAGERLSLAFLDPGFLRANLAQLSAIQAAFRAAAVRLAEGQFSHEAWQEDGTLRPLPLLAAQLWDDRGLLGRIAAADLCRMCHGEGPLHDSIGQTFTYAARGAEGLLALGRLAELEAETVALLPECAVPSLRDRPDAPIEERLADCEAAVREKEKLLAAAVRRLREEIGAMNIDQSGMLDPVVERLLSFLPEGTGLTPDRARAVLFFSRRSGTLYEPVQARIEETKQDCRYLRSLRVLHGERLEECLRLAEAGDVEGARPLFAELEPCFDDLDYASVAVLLGMGGVSQADAVS